MYILTLDFSGFGDFYTAKRSDYIDPGQSRYHHVIHKVGDVNI